MRRAFEVEEANTYVRLYNYGKDMEKSLRSFSLRKLSRWAKVPGDQFGSHKYEISHVFATFSPDKTEYRLSRGFYSKLLSHLKQEGWNTDDIQPTKCKEIEPVKVTHLWKNNKAMRPRDDEQQEYLDFTLQDDKAIVVINGRTGFGKALHNDSLVQTPTGWVRIGDIKVEDEVISRDGSVTKVTGVYPQGVKQLNKITFWDGRTSICCDEHLWKIFDAKYSKWKVCDTTELKRLQERKQLRTYIPLALPYDGGDKNLPIDPYLFGALLGDGGFSILNECSFTNNDTYVVEKVNNKLKEIGLKLTPKSKRTSFEYRVASEKISEDTGRRSFFNIINDLKLQCLSIEKHIPDVFLEGSIEQRLELLRGLMDTDGDVVKGGTAVYNTSSEKLALGVQRLVWSLGGIARITSRVPTYKYLGEKKEGNVSYRVSIRIPNPESIVTLPRKLERLSNDNQYATKLKLRIKSIEQIEEGAATCISVDHPDKLFITNDHIVTHNTVVAIMAFVELGYRVVITVLPRYVPIWVKACREFLNMTPADIINVSDFDINDLSDRLKSKKLNPKVIIFQLTRIDTYIKRMREQPETIPPLDDFFTTLGGGMRLIDEAHESIYSVYTSMLYGNFKKNIGLSATLNGDDDFINEVYNAAFPPEAYLKPPVYDKYIHVVGYMHRLNVNKYKIRTKGFGGYSHVLYESGILKNRQAFENYYQLCKQAFEDYYLNGYREGQKAMWFFATVAFCKKFEERLKKDYPDMDIFTFTGEVSKKKGMEEEYNNHQVVITTPGSCGTGKDIPKLFIVFACVAISSSQRNDQMNGRTRPIDKWWPDLDPIFLYFICLDVPKQVEYHKKRRRVLDKKTKKFSLIDSGMWV